MTIKVITAVKDDLLGLKRTERSINGQSERVAWTLVTPNDGSVTNRYAKFLSNTGIVSEILLDAQYGIYAAMNQAIASANSEDWLWFLNAGDEFASINTYQLVNQYALSATNVWMYGGHFLGSQRGEILGEAKAPKKFQASNQLFTKKYISHQSTIFRASLLQELGGFNTNYKIAADWDLMVRASSYDTGQFIDKTIAVFYLGGVSTKERQIANFELLQLRKKYLGRRFMIKNYTFFFYRFIRNFIVLKLETLQPDFVNFIREIKFKFK